MAIYKKKKGKDKGMKKKSSGSKPVKLGSPGGSIKQSSDPIISDIPIQSNETVTINSPKITGTNPKVQPKKRKNK